MTLGQNTLPQHINAVFYQKKDHGDEASLRERFKRAYGKKRVFSPGAACQGLHTGFSLHKNSRYRYGKGKPMRTPGCRGGNDLSPLRR